MTIVDELPASSEWPDFVFVGKHGPMQLSPGHCSVPSARSRDRVTMKGAAGAGEDCQSARTLWRSQAAVRKSLMRANIKSGDSP